jgi:hypothetical protein
MAAAAQKRERSLIVAYAFALPIPAGKTEEVRRLTEECLGPRRAEFDDMMRRSGLTEESYWVQRDPERGDLLVVFGREDLTAFNAIMVNPQTEFDSWYRDQFTAILGLTRPLTLGLRTSGSARGPRRS